MDSGSKNILVTGGNGFIGSHVIDKLLSLGHHVTNFDRRQPPGERENVTKVLGDIKDPNIVNETVSKVDGVINLAGILGTSETINGSYETADVNINGALTFFDAIKKYNIPAVQITVGNYLWYNAYAITKYTSERLALMYNKEYGTKIAVVRGLNVYGSRQKHFPVKKVVPNFILQALNNEDITMYGDGMQKLDLIYIDDTVEVLTRALLMEHGCYDNTMEAGSGKLYTAKKLAETILKSTESTSKIKYLPMRAGEPIRSVTKGDPDTLAPIDYTPSTSLDDGIKKTIPYYKNEYKHK